MLGVVALEEAEDVAVLGWDLWDASAVSRTP